VCYHGIDCNVLNFKKKKKKPRWPNSNPLFWEINFKYFSCMWLSLDFKFRRKRKQIWRFYWMYTLQGRPCPKNSSHFHPLNLVWCTRWHISLLHEWHLICCKWCKEKMHRSNKRHYAYLHELHLYLCMYSSLYTCDLYNIYLNVTSSELFNFNVKFVHRHDPKKIS